MRNKILTVLLIMIVLLLVGCSKSDIGKLGSAHEHADFKVYINGEPLNFSKSEYMLKSKYVHLENMEGTHIHKHATGITLGYFFDSLGIKFDDSCFVLDNGTSYCNQDDKTLKFYVNGEENFDFENYFIKDKDEILIEYKSGDKEDAKK